MTVTRIGSALAFLSAVSAMAPTQSPAGTTVLRFGHLWDGARIVDDAAVIIDAGTITAVGTGLSTPPGAAEVDLRSFTALPGLIDLHTHVTYYWNRDPATH